MELEYLVSIDAAQEEVEIIGEKKSNVKFDEFKFPSQGPFSFEIKKEKLEQLKDNMQEAIESVIKESTFVNPPKTRTLSTSSTSSNPTTTFTDATFNKIRNSSKNINNKRFLNIRFLVDVVLQTSKN